MGASRLRVKTPTTAETYRNWVLVMEVLGMRCVPKPEKHYAPLKLILYYFSQPHHLDSLIDLCSFFQNSITDLCTAVGYLRNVVMQITISYTNIKDYIKFSKEITTLLFAHSKTSQCHIFNNMSIHKNDSNKLTNQMQQFYKFITWCFVSLNMFRAPPRPSSGAYNCINSLWFYLGAWW